MRVIDLSWWQYPVDTAAMAPAADGFIVRWSDWSSWASGDGEDTGHNDVIRGLQAHGKPCSSYLFPRPEMASAVHQIDTWASRVNAPMTMPPLLDIEQSGITGNALMDWTEEALTRMREVWGWVPLHYFNASIAGNLGTWRPTSPHLLMVPGYPYADTARVKYPWDGRDGWVDTAGGAGAVADYLPPGYGTADVTLWQYTSTALVPGTGNSVDVSHVYPAFTAALGGASSVNVGQDIVDLARTQIGVKESPPNSNQVRYWDWWGASLGPWCGVVVSYIYSEAGYPLPDLNPFPDPGGAVGFVLVSSAQVYAYRNNQAVADPQPGDIVIFSWVPWAMIDGIATCTAAPWKGAQAGDHTGIFVGWNGAPGGGFTCLEGNTSNTDWSDGGAFMERSDRDASQVCCWWRPHGGAGGFGVASFTPKEMFTVGQFEDLSARLDGQQKALDRVNNQTDRLIFYLDALARNAPNTTAGESDLYPYTAALFGLHEKANILLGDAAKAIQSVNDSYANLDASLDVAQQKLDALGRAVLGPGVVPVVPPVPVVDPRKERQDKLRAEIAAADERLRAEMAAAEQRALELQRERERLRAELEMADPAEATLGVP